MMCSFAWFRELAAGLRRVGRWPSLLAVGWLLGAWSGQAAECVWTGQAEATDLRPGLVVFSEAEPGVEPAMRRPAGGRDEVVTIRVDAPQPLEAMLALGVPDAEELTVAIERGGVWQTVYAQRRDASFHERLTASSRLAVPLRLEPGVQRLRLTYEIHLNGRLHPRLYRPEAWQTAEASRHLLNGFLIGAMSVLWCGVLLFHLVTGGPRRHLAYLGLVAAQIVMVPQVEGYYFQYLWPGWPGFNQWTPALVSTLVLGGHIGFALALFQLPERYPVMARLHYAVLAVLLANLVASPWDQHRAFWVLCGLAPAYAVLALWNATRVLRDRLVGAVQYFCGTAILVLCLLVLLPLGAMGLNPLPQVDFLIYPKLGFTFEAVLFCLTLLSQLLHFRQAQAEARMRRLAETEELLEAERRKRAAEQLAEQSHLRLAAASHDISQPLSSLRFALDALRAGQNQQATAEHLDRTLTYAQTLLRDIIQETRDRPAAERLRLGDLLAEVAAEHRPAAVAKGLALHVVDSSAAVDASHLVLRRIVHNLLGNAVRYTRKGRVLAGVRRRAGGWEIEIHDTGPGLPPGQETHLQQAFARQDTSQDGFGLGLYIVKTLCDQNGYRLRVRSRLQRGSCFAVWLPDAGA